MSPTSATAHGDRRPADRSRRTASAATTTPGIGVAADAHDGLLAGAEAVEEPDAGDGGADRRSRTRLQDDRTRRRRARPCERGERRRRRARRGGRRRRSRRPSSGRDGERRRGAAAREQRQRPRRGSTIAGPAAAAAGPRRARRARGGAGARAARRGEPCRRGESSVPPDAGLAARPGGAAGRGRLGVSPPRSRSDPDALAQGGEALLADARDLVELVDGAEAAVLGAVVEDLLGRGRADAVERVELLEGRGVEVQRLVRRARRRRRRPPRRRADRLGARAGRGSGGRPRAWPRG